MAVLTDKARTDNAIRLYHQAQEMFFAFGGSDTEWPNPSTPPIEDPSLESIAELIGLKKVTKVSLAVKIATQSGENVVSSGGSYYELIGLSEAYVRKATYVYIGTDVEEDDFYKNRYRTVALTSNPLFGQDTTGNAVPADFVVNQGTLQVISNSPVRDLTKQKIREFAIISA